MDERERIRQLRLLVEEFGLLFEEMGRTRMDGRVAAWLLLADPPVQSLTEIADALGVSKASVSTAARSLLQAGMVERVSEPGQRGDSYRSLPGKFDGMLPLSNIETMDRLVDHSLALIADRDQSQSNYALLHELHDFLDFLKSEIPGLMARWRTHRSALVAAVHDEDLNVTPDRGGAE